VGGLGALLGRNHRHSGSIVRRLLCAAAVLLLLGLAWWSVTGGIRNAQQATTIGQQAETVIQLACGLLSLAVGVTRFRWGRRGRAARVGWAATLAATAGLSALVWGPPMPPIALLFVAVALLLAWVILWALGPAPGHRPWR
jgi:hypothetical protein